MTLSGWWRRCDGKGTSFKELRKKNRELKWENRQLKEENKTLKEMIDYLRKIYLRQEKEEKDKYAASFEPRKKELIWA